MKKYRLLLWLVALTAILFNNTSAQTTSEVLVNSRGTNSVIKYDANGNYLGDFIGPGLGGLSAPEDIFFHPDGSVLVTGLGNTVIKKYNGKTGAYLGNFSSGYSLSMPSKMAMGPDSLIYVTQWGATQNKVVRFNLLGNYVDEFTAIAAPKGLGQVWDKKKNFYIALYGNGADGTIHKFDSLGNDSGTFINSNILQGPTSIWFDAAGDMLVEDWTAGNILRFDSAGNYKGIFTSGMTNPEGVAFFPDGRFLVGDWGTDNVHLVNSNGTLAGPFCMGYFLTDPNCVKIRPSTTVSVAEVKKDDFSITPSSGRQFTITSTGTEKIKAEIIVINSFGQVIEKYTSVLPAVWNADSYPAGIYFIAVSSAGKICTNQVLVIQNR